MEMPSNRLAPRSRSQRSFLRSSVFSVPSVFSVVKRSFSTLLRQTLHHRLDDVEQPHIDGYLAVVLATAQALTGEALGGMRHEGVGKARAPTRHPHRCTTCASARWSRRFRRRPSTTPEPRRWSCATIPASRRAAGFARRWDAPPSRSREGRRRRRVPAAADNSAASSCRRRPQSG